jgi:hypothetical protein
MRYMFLISSDEKVRESMSPAEREKAAEQIWAVIDEATERGIFRGAEPLQPN